MIEFPCTCGYRFSVPQELAGSSIQCPQCKLLVDVPRLSEVSGLDEDGTFRLLDPDPELVDPARSDELVEIFRPGRQDVEGDEIDLRVTMDDVLKAGVIEEGTIGAREEFAPPLPKYDPVTGELIEAIPIKNDTPQPVRAIPLGPPTLQYSKEEPGRLSMWKIPTILLSRPGSLAVLTVIVIIHLICLVPVIMCGFGGLFIGAVIYFFAFVLLFAHYANIVEELGPMDQDELPAPLRGADITDDIVFPFFHFTGALFICYVPAFIFMGKTTFHAGLGMLVVSTFLFPAVLLTLCTSGDMVNLRPDRVFGLIGKAGGHYVVSMVLWVAASISYFLGFLAMLNIASGVLWGSGSSWTEVGISSALLLGGILLMHVFSTHLGLLYRKRHDSFPWVYQKHIHARPLDKMPRRRKPYMGRPMPRPARRAPVAPPPPQLPPNAGLGPLRVMPLEQTAPSSYNRGE